MEKAYYISSKVHDCQGPMNIPLQGWSVDEGHLLQAVVLGQGLVATSPGPLLYQLC